MVHLTLVLCHIGAARSGVVDGREGLQLFRASISISNKELRKADKGWYFSGLHGGLTGPRLKDENVILSDNFRFKCLKQTVLWFCRGL